MATCVTPRQVSNLLSPLISPNKKQTSTRSNDTQYKQLLSTYSNYAWCHKPLPLSPLQCARWGWQSTGKDILQCKLCNVKIQFISAFQPWQSAQYDRICREFGIQLQTAHLPACPWSNKPLSRDVVLGGSLSLGPDRTFFNKAVSELFKMFTKDNKAPIIELPGYALTKLYPVLTLLLKSLQTRDSTSELTLTVGNVTMVLLALFGWRKTEDGLPTIKCELCLRTLGLWNFRKLDSETSELTVEPDQCSWGESRTYTLYSTDSGSENSRSRELSSASEVSHSLPSDHTSPEKDTMFPNKDSPDTPVKSGDTPSPLGDTPGDTSGDSTPALPAPVSFGNPDIFLPLASFMLFQSKEDKLNLQDKPADETTSKASADCKSEAEAKQEARKAEKGGREVEEDSPPSRSTRSRTAASPGFRSPSNTPTHRITRSRSKQGSSESYSSPLPPTTRKRKSKTSESPPATRSTRHTRSASASMTSPMTLEPTRKRRKSKIEQTETLIGEIMRSSPSQLDLTSDNPSNLNLIKEHHYWCPWVCTLPSYHINSAYRNTPTRLADQGHTKVSVVDMTDSTGWEALLFHLSTTKTPDNAWVAVHSMLQDCVSLKK